jgi:hypothetical protein
MDVYLPSDCRIKESICPISSILSNIDKLNFVSYSYNNQTKPPCDIGVIAQELKGVFPNMVNIKEGTLSNMYTMVEHNISDDIVSIHYISEDVKENDTFNFTIRGKNGIVYHTCVVLNVTDMSFQIKPWDGYSPDDVVMTRGRIIPDFHSVNYTELSMLGPAGVKELHQIVKQHGATICAQQEQITALQEQVATILAKLG